MIGRLLRVATALVSVAALARLLAARRRAAVGRPAPATDPAEELRRKLAETRDGDGAVAAAPDAGAPAAAEDVRRLDLEERRRLVHAKAQQALDEIQAVE